MMGIKQGLLLWFSFIFDKDSKGRCLNIPLEFNEQLAKELHKPIIRNLKKEQFILDLEIIFGVLI